MITVSLYLQLTDKKPLVIKTKILDSSSKLKLRLIKYLITCKLFGFNN